MTLGAGPGLHQENRSPLNQEVDMLADAKAFNAEGPNIAWFRDPAGNFLSVIQED